MKYVITFILGAVCGIAAFIFLCCVAVARWPRKRISGCGRCAGR